MSASPRGSPKLTIEAQERRRRGLVDQNFFFIDPLSFADLARHPSRRRHQLETIRKLGRWDFESYLESVDPNTKVAPWRRARPWRATHIAELARDLKACRDSEYGWRLKLEQTVLNPFSVESACESCTGRFWAPELRTRHERTSVDLDMAYEENRTRACVCETNGQRHYLLNRLFQDKLDEPARYPSHIQKLVGKVERPDRIFGLRRPAGFEQVQHELERRCIKLSIHKQEANFLIFPFLVLEAKSHESSDSFDDIDMQTAYAILETLRIQSELAKAANKMGSDDFQGAFAWYISYKGEHWRVHVAFTEFENQRLAYKVCRVWEGSVDHLDDALRLTLIVDHIVDWARTEYRSEIGNLVRVVVPATETLLQPDGQGCFRDTPQHVRREDESYGMENNDDEATALISLKKEIMSPLAKSIETQQLPPSKLSPLEVPFTPSSTVMPPTSIQPSEMSAMQWSPMKNIMSAASKLSLLSWHRHLKIRRPFIKSSLTRFIFDVDLDDPPYNRSEIKPMLNSLEHRFMVLRKSSLAALENFWLCSTTYRGLPLSLMAEVFLVILIVGYYVDEDGHPVRELRYFAFSTRFLEQVQLSFFPAVMDLENVIQDNTASLERQLVTLHDRSAQQIIHDCVNFKNLHISSTRAEEGLSSDEVDRVFNITLAVAMLLVNSRYTQRTVSFQDLEVPIPVSHSANGGNRVNLNSSTLSAIYYSGTVPYSWAGQADRPFSRGSATIFLFRPVHNNASFSFGLLIANGRPKATDAEVLNQLGAIEELKHKYPGYPDAHIFAILRNNSISPRDPRLFQPINIVAQQSP